jgi:hypothetical protein
MRCRKTWAGRSGLAIEARMYDGVAGMVRRTAARRPKGVQ